MYCYLIILTFIKLSGEIVDFKAKLLVKPGTIPKLCKSRSLSIAIKGAIEGELDRLKAAGIMERVTHSDWAALIVALLGKKMMIPHLWGLQGDSKCNSGCWPVSPTKPSELSATLAGGKTFTKLELSQAYQQLLLDQKSAVQSMLIKGYIDITHFLLV